MSSSHLKKMQGVTTLVEMYTRSIELNAKSEMFGVKSNGSYRWMTYQEFGQQVDQLRGGLAHIGVSARPKGAIISSNKVPWAVACYSILGLGGQWTSMYENQRAEDWEYILNNSQAEVLFVSRYQIYRQIEQMRSRLPHLAHLICIESHSDLTTPTYQQLLELGKTHPKEIIFPKKEDLACLIYTSGTTGRPKGVMLSHDNIMFNLNQVPDLIDIGPKDRSLSFLPWAHIFGQVAEVHFLLYAGYSTGLAEDVSTIVSNLSEVRPTLLFSVPRIFNKIYDGVQAQMKEKGGLVLRLFERGLILAEKKREGEKLSLRESFLLALVDKVIFAKVRAKFGGRLRYAVSGASALGKEVAQFIENLNIKVIEAYGLSETAPLVSANTLEKRRLGSVGQVIPEVKVVLDSSVVDEEARREGQGEIVVYGRNVMMGYHQLPEETSQVITADGGFRTGDVGRFDDDGYLYITGRIKEIYKLENGRYVAPAAVEEVLRLSPYISQVFIYGANRAYNVGVIVVDWPQLQKYARQHRISAEGDGLLQHPQIRDLYKLEIKTLSNRIKGYERLNDFALTREEWTPENGLLTPTLKLKRKSLVARYQPTINSFY